MLSHIDIAHFILSKHVRKGDTVIDATCGNGHDAALLADLALSPEKGMLYCFDIQKAAIDATQERLKNHPHFDKIIFCNTSHDNLPKCSPSAIVYNLGYLPGGDKAITTMTASTFSSCNRALKLLKPGGALFITFYPGHAEGKNELLYTEKWVPKITSAGFKIFVYKQYTANFAPQLWVIKKPFQKNPFTTI